MPDCSFEELIPIFSARYSWDHLWLRPAMKRYGIWRLVHRSHPENSRPMTRSPRNHRITIIYQILHLMYCRTYVNLYDAVRSVIPCDKLHKHQFSFNNDAWPAACFVRLGTGIPIRGQLFCIMGLELSWNQLWVYFAIFLDSWYHAPDKFSGWIESLLLLNKMIDFKYQTQQE